MKFIKMYIVGIIPEKELFAIIHWRIVYIQSEINNRILEEKNSMSYFIGENLYTLNIQTEERYHGVLFRI